MARSRDRSLKSRSRDRRRDRSRDRKRRSRSRSRNDSPARRRNRDGHKKYQSSRHRSSSVDSGSDRRGRDRHRRPEKYSKSKNKKHRRHRGSSSSSSSSSHLSGSSTASNSSTEILLRLEEERRRLKEKRREEKERLKQEETAEEKRKRRLMKKELKAIREANRKGVLAFGQTEQSVASLGTGGSGTLGNDEELQYTNDDNPFGDSNLTKTFRWNKKLEKEGLGKASEKDLARMARQNAEAQRQELEKVKLSRQQREREREERQVLLDLEQRSRDNENFSKWQEQEDEFHLQQARLRSKIRIQDGRAKPIDLLAKYISPDEEVDTIEMHEPYTYLNGLTITDLEDLLEDIKVYNELDSERNKDFWNDIVVIVQDELQKLRKAESMHSMSQYEQAADRRLGINTTVAPEVQKVFMGKSAAQLAQLQTSIETKLRQRAEGVDISYWESLLSQLKAHLARARLRDKHKENLQKKLEVLKAEQMQPHSDPNSESEEKAASPVQEVQHEPTVDSAEINIDDDDGETQPRTEESEPGPSSKQNDDEESSAGRVEESFETPEDVEKSNSCIKAYNAGNYSPRYYTQDDLELGTFIVLEEEDRSKLDIDQNKARRGAKVDNALSAEEKALEREARKGMNAEEEASFAVESALEQTYEWSDKYRPRKPRYFNRVHTGFEWNKYNQTHYDLDNPPPKIVQGYKFNIFYPDLIDKGATPQYTLTPCEDNRDFCVLRVKAGPPYEDIAFKIVNREWEFGYKRGFKCQFQNNIFQLWFHFKRLRYRR